MRLLYICLLAFPVMAFSAPALAGEEELVIRFIDVGEGDAILISSPEGKTALVDAGNLVTGHKVAEMLKERGGALDHLIFTHPHMDHIGGAFHVLQSVRIRRIYDNGQDISEMVESSDPYRWYRDLVREDTRYSALVAGDSLNLGGARLDILWPEAGKLSKNFNDNSLVIAMVYGKFRALLTGDLTVKGEGGLLKTDADLKADVLKVAHHGWEDATGDDFIDAVSPKTAVISVNEGNTRGYPSPKTLEKLKGRGVKTYRTDIDGDIVIKVNKDGVFGVTVDRSAVAVAR